MQLKEGKIVNNDPGLELEADTMGEKVLNSEITYNKQTTKRFHSTVIQRELIRGKLNIVGERHDLSDNRRDEEKKFALEKGYGEYWEEHEYQIGAAPGFFSLSSDERPTGDSTFLRFINAYKLLDEMSERMEHGIWDETNKDKLIFILHACDTCINVLYPILDDIGTEWYQQQVSGFEMLPDQLEKLKRSKKIVNQIIETQTSYGQRLKNLQLRGKE